MPASSNPLALSTHPTASETKAETMSYCTRMITKIYTTGEFQVREMQSTALETEYTRPAWSDPGTTTENTAANATSAT